MATDLTFSSWHPAFMPNSIAELDRKSGSVSTSEATATRGMDLKSSRSSEYSVESFGEPKSQITSDVRLPDVDKQALTNSTLSAGDERLSNNQSESLGGSTLGSTDDSPLFVAKEQVKSSDSRLTENKHLSKASFTRTVSDQVSWAEEDTPDAGWTIPATVTQSSDLTPVSARIKPFPAVPSASEPVPRNLDHQVSGNLTNETVQGIGHNLQGRSTDEIQSGESLVDLLSRDDTNGWDPTSVQTGIIWNGTEDFGQVCGGTLQDVRGTESQARYEEGVPLLETSSQQNDIVSSYDTENLHELGGSQPTFLDETMGPGEDSDFFSQSREQVGEGSHKSAPPQTLKRKSTSQVLDALDFSSGEAVNGGGKGIQRAHQSFLTDIGDEDLAAKWQAALAEDELLGDEADLLNDDKVVAENQALDPATFFGSDDEGFLEEDSDQHEDSANANRVSLTTPAQLSGRTTAVKSVSDAAHSGSIGSNRYMPADFTATVPSPHDTYSVTTLGKSDPLLPNIVPSSTRQPVPYGGFQAQSINRPQRPDLPKAQSFADRSKGGYTSPYDLPMEVVKPRKRSSIQQMSRNATSPMAIAAPPRTTSVNINAPPRQNFTSDLTPPSSSHSDRPSQLQPSRFLVSPVGPIPPKPKPTQHGFFEDLPTSSRPKPAGRMSTSSQISPRTSIPPSSLGHPESYTSHSVHNHAYQSAANRVASPTTHDLVAPERVNPFAPSPSHTHPPAPVSRYSPAPAQSSGEPAPRPLQARYPPTSTSQRYSSPNPATPLLNQSVPLAHQPRTSSPLAHFERNNGEPPPWEANDEIDQSRRSSSATRDTQLRNQPFQTIRSNDEIDHDRHDRNAHVEHQKAVPSQYGQMTSPGRARRNTRTPPQSHALLGKTSSQPTKRAASTYLPPKLNASSSSVIPPVRSQTQSPGTAMSGPRLEMNPSSPYPRPASVEVPSSPRMADSVTMAVQPLPVIDHSRGHSQSLHYLTPADGRELDPLQRWKGCPIIFWGIGGSIVTSFPKDVPRYGAGQAIPSMTRSLGEIKIRNIRDIDDSEEKMITFPGPLKGKGKKKDVLSWLTSRINILEQNALYIRANSQLSFDDKRVEERVLLWKLLRTFIEHDGLLEGTVAVEKAVRSVLSPSIDGSSQTEQLYSTGAELSGICFSASTTARIDSVDPAAVDQLRKHLLQGERERAVWEAVDKRLWAHAMLISNTVSNDLYKQVAQEFVQKEVKRIGDNTEPLAALYDIFAGNFEESIDELVPPSARAGFQLVSTSKEMDSSKDALQGLDRWRETLGLILSNRSIDDVKALNAMGKLLAGYGRAEAAHICFIFARNESKFSGIDDPASNIVLLGSDHLRQPHEFDKDMEAILLSEIFEFGLLLAKSSNASSVVPHLAVYKLQHAFALADYGHRDKALQYCEIIASTITSQTRRSLYHHPLLVASLDDFSRRLKQLPKDESTSWIPKPSMDKVSGSVWATFNKFVAGDDAETAGSSTPGSNSDVGPFARIAGNTPAMSREASHVDMYTAHDIGINASHGLLAKTTSRYAPGGTYTPPSYEFQTTTDLQPRMPVEERRSDEVRRQYEPRRQVSDYRPTSQPVNNTTEYISHNSQWTSPSSYPPYSEPNSSYAPENPRVSTPPAASFSHHPQSLDSTIGAQESALSVLHSRPSPDVDYDQDLSNEHGVSSLRDDDLPTSTANELVTSNNREPSSRGYEPPSYQAFHESESPEKTRFKRNSTYDDDDDIAGRGVHPPAAATEKTKAQKDRETDEAFRKAAEEDAKQDPHAQPAPKKGWLGGWFGGKKDISPGSSEQPTNKPIRAKLGEANNFYYDPDQKRWINKKAGADAAPTPTATPPPPRAAAAPPLAYNAGSQPISTATPPSMTRSASSAPSVGPTRRAHSSPSVQAENPTPVPPDGLLRATGPSALSRSQSNSSLNVATASSGLPSRPGTSMSNASSIDDLLGPTGARNKGTTRKAKKGRGYIDVMGDKAS